MQTNTHADWPLPASELMPALELMRLLARADFTALFLHDEATGALFPALVNGMDNDLAPLLGIHTAGIGAFGRAMTEQRRVVIRNATTYDGLEELAKSIGFRSIEIVPLWGVDHAIVGELAIMYRHAPRTSRRQVRLVEQLGKLVVCAVLQARRGLSAELARDSVHEEVSRRTQALARVSHELRTPLQAIAGYLELLREGVAEPLAPEQSRMLGRVYDNEQMLEHVIDDLVALSHIETGQARFAITSVSASDALRVACAVAMPSALRRGVLLSASNCPGLYVAADPDKLTQILVNITVNAVKFSPPGSTVSLACGLDEDGVTIRFDVTDHGCGIAPSGLTRIFEPYVQLATDTVEGFGGTGLGLAISRDFVREMHGDLTVVSALGAGSVFSVHLPRATTALPGQH